MKTREQIRTRLATLADRAADYCEDHPGDKNAAFALAVIVDKLLMAMAKR